jgi:hypothetical protein
VSSRQGKACIDNAPTAVANRLSKPAFVYNCLLAPSLF